MLIILQSILWAVFGTILYREGIVNKDLPRILGRTLYWLGVPLQIFFLARQSNFEQIVWLPPVTTIVVLLIGLLFSFVIAGTLKQLMLSVVTKLTPQNQIEGLLISVSLAVPKPTRQLVDRITPKGNYDTGSFILASILGNTGFVGLALVPSLVDSSYWSWIVLYGLVHNVLGSYGLGVLIADYYSNSQHQKNWWHQLQSLLFLPSLWAFAYGYFSRDLPLPGFIDSAIAYGVMLVVPGAFILIGMQLSQLQQWQNLTSGLLPATIKMLLIPSVTALLLTCLGITGEGRLTLILMSSMPSAFASIILTEEYNLDRQVAASSILLSTLLLPVVIYIWLTIF